MRECGSPLEEFWNLRNVTTCETFVDPFSEQSLFELQFNLCTSTPHGYSMQMKWDDAGQLPLQEATRILEMLGNRNEELAAELKRK